MSNSQTWVIEGNEFSEGGNCYVSQGLVKTGDPLTYSKFKARCKGRNELCPDIFVKMGDILVFPDLMRFPCQSFLGFKSAFERLAAGL